MEKSLNTTISVFLLITLMYSSISSAAPNNEGVEIEVLFSGNFGSTITDETGTYFNINFNSYYLDRFNYDPWGGVQQWYTSYEPKVYIDKYHYGSTDFEFSTDVTTHDVLSSPDAGVPLYFFDTEAQITLVITNNSPAAKQNLRIESEAFTLNIDGSNGTSFGNQQTQDIVVRKGETVYIDASFIANYQEGMESGLDRYSVRVSHPNNGARKGNQDAALIAEFEAIFCPPDHALSTLGFQP